MNKKALTQRTLVILIICCVTALLLGFFVASFAKTMKKGNHVELCRQSIALAAQTKKLPTIMGAGRQITPLNCPREDLVIRRGDVVRKGVIDQDRAHKIIADAMAECWYMVGEGKMDPMSNWDNKGENYCLVCKKIVFDKSLQRFMGAHANDINLTYFTEEKGMTEQQANETIRENVQKYFINSPDHYIMTTNYKATGKTYYEYLYNEKPGELSQEAIDVLQHSIYSPNGLIFLNMYKYEQKTWWGTVAKIVGGLVLAIAGLIFAPFTGGASLSLTFIGVSALAAGLIVAGIVIGAVVMAITTTVSAFTHCEECDAVGGISFLHAHLKLSDKIEICKKNCDTYNPEMGEAPICTILVN